MAFDRHFDEVERLALERLARAGAVDWWKLREPLKRQAWLEAEEALADVREARRRWRASGRIPGFESIVRMMELAFKLKQFAAGIPSETKEVVQHFEGKISLEWENDIRKAYGLGPEVPIIDCLPEPAVVPTATEAAEAVPAGDGKEGGKA